MISTGRLHEIAGTLAAVPGIRAVVLGGSRARGTHHHGSDVDLGLYYDAAAIDLPALNAAARRVGGPGAQVSGPGGWGPWVDGGGWLTIDGTAVDLILRNTSRVRHQRDRAIRGEFAIHAQTGHPLGFLDIAYAGEAATCRPLSDPDEIVPELRQGLTPYPSALRRALVEHQSSAVFQLDGARKATVRGDAAYVLLSCTTAVLWCAHAWHAVAGVWVTNEKGLLPGVARLPVETDGFADAAAAALAAVGRAGGDPGALRDGLRGVIALVDRSVADTRNAL